jgi:hypothetical protein
MTVDYTQFHNLSVLIVKLLIYLKHNQYGKKK